MATKIVTKNSSTAASVPTAAQLVQGELAVNVADKRLYTEDNAGAIVELGTNPLGEIIANGGIALGDNNKATFGTSDDLQIYHDGSNSYISDVGTGDLRVLVAGLDIQTGGGVSYLTASSNRVVLKHTGNDKLTTTATGISVTGTVVADGLTVDGSTTLSGLDVDSTTPQIKLNETDVTDQNTQIIQASGSVRVRTVTDAGALVAERLRIDHGTGDIILFKDEGVTQSFYWDASTARLGLGTTSPQGDLSISDGGAQGLEINANSSGDTRLFAYNRSTNAEAPMQIRASEVNFSLGGSNRMVVSTTGIDVTGTVVADGLTVTTASTANLGTYNYSSVDRAKIEGQQVGGAGGKLDFQTNAGAGLISRMNIDHIGNVGIGTVAPTAYTNFTTLAVGDAAQGGVLELQYAGVQAARIVAQAANTLTIATNNTERMRIDSSGNVSIGSSTNPDSRKLRVYGISEIDGAGVGLLKFKSSGTEIGSVGQGNYVVSGGPAGGFGMHAAADLVFGSGGTTERMRIDGSGNVLIQTSDARLRGGNTTGRFIVSNSDTTSYITANGSANASPNTLSLITNTEIKMHTGASYTERMRIDSSGRVGIGVSTVAGYSNGSLQIHATSALGAGLWLTESASGSGVSDGLRLVQYNNNTTLYNGEAGYMALGTANTERMRIDSSGNLLVGTTSQFASGKVSIDAGTSSNGLSIDVGYALGAGFTGISIDRTGADGQVLSFNRAGTAVGNVSVTGTATAYNTSSDQRLKENIADADDAGYKIDAIQVRKYDWKADGAHQDYGMIAQELQLVAPEAVSGDADSEEMMGVDYSKLVPMLIKEIQSLRNRVATLEE